MYILICYLLAQLWVRGVTAEDDGTVLDFSTDNACGPVVPTDAKKDWSSANSWAPVASGVQISEPGCYTHGSKDLYNLVFAGDINYYNTTRFVPCKPHTDEFAGRYLFMVLDGDCEVLGSWISTKDYPTEKNPWKLEANFLPYVYVVTEASVAYINYYSDFSPVDPRRATFTGYYAGPEYKIKKNHCNCNYWANVDNDMYSVWCQCAFPRNGTSES